MHLRALPRKLTPTLRTLLWLALAALAAFALAACEDTSPAEKPSPPPSPVEVIKVKPQKLARTLEAVGTLRSGASAEIAADISGKVVALNILEGERVEKGHVLARLEASDTAADLAIAQARVAGAATTLERSEALYGEKLVSKQVLDEAAVQKRAAQGQVARSRALLNKSVIRAPFSGTLGLREVSVGQYVAPGTPITHITDNENIEFVFTIPERRIPDLAEGQPVRGVVGDCKQTFLGKVAVIDPVVDPDTRSVRVQAKLANDAGSLKPGMSVRARVEVGKEQDALLVPEEAVIRRGTRTQVYVVDEKTKQAQPSQVTVGEQRLGQVVILSGLSEGDTLVVKGHQRLRPGATVAPKPYKQIKNPLLALGREDASGECWF